jgi:hypothetical protein
VKRGKTEDSDSSDATAQRGRLNPTTRRLIRSYGLLILIAIGFLLMAMLVREKDRTVPAESARFPKTNVVSWS